MTKITRRVPRELLVDTWGLPYEGYEGVEILDDIDQGSGRWESYHMVVFRAPDDGEIYGADYNVGLTEYQDQRPWEDEREVTITRLEKHERVITVTDWKYVEQQEVPVPTLSELKKKWASKLERDEEEAAWAMEW